MFPEKIREKDNTVLPDENLVLKAMFIATFFLKIGKTLKQAVYETNLH